jgi:MFS family permease
VISPPGCATPSLVDASLARTWRFVGGRATNTFGRAIINTAVLWELWERTEDKLVLAMVGVMQIIPVVLLFGAAGWLADHLDRRKLASAAAFAMGLVGVGLAIASATHAPIAVYLMLLLVQGCVTALHAPATSSLLPNIAPREALPRANRMLASLAEIAQIGGPALAGLALVELEASWVFAVTGVTGAVSAALYLSIGHIARPPSTTVDRKDWRVGLRFIFRSPLLLSALTLDMFAVLFAGVTALLPVVATEILGVGSFGYGILRASMPIGAVSMAIIGGRIRAWQRPGRVLLIVVAVYGVVTIAIGLSTWLPVTALCLVAAGALDNISVVIRLTLEQNVVPDRIRGRVAAVHNVFIGMSNELGAAESGAAAALLGTVPAIVGGGALAIAVVGVVIVKWPELARMPPLAELEPPPD